VIVMRKLLSTAVALLALLSWTATALGSGKTVINDCSDDEVLSKTYTQKEYRDALAQLPADADQYGNCRDVIARAQEAAATKGGSKGNGGSDSSAGATAGGDSSGGQGPSTAPATDQLAAASPEDRAAAADATRLPSGASAGAEPVVTAAGVGRAPGSDGGAGLPTPLIVLLALLLAGALVLTASRIQTLVNARRA